VDVAKTIGVEGELDNIIFSCHEKQVEEEDARPALEMWQESELKYAERRREENRQAWASFHETQAESHRRTLASLIADHEEKARKLLAAEDRGRAKL
jgi:hypothetical protein